jgi:putative ABC transport system permease protein
MVVGFVALATFQGYLQELMSSQLAMSYARNMIGEIMVRKPGSAHADAKVHPEKYWLGAAEQQFVDAWVAQQGAEVKASSRSLFSFGMVTAGGSSAAFIAIGHDIAQGRLARRDWQWNAWAGHPIREDEPNGIMLGLQLSQALGCEKIDRTAVFDPQTARPSPVERPFKCRTTQVQLQASSATGRANAVDGEIVGLTSGEVREYDQQMMWAPLSLIQSLLETDQISVYNIVLKDPEQAQAKQGELRRAAQAAGIQIEVLDWRDSEYGEMYRRGTELMGTYRSLVVLVLLVIAGSAVLTTMAKTVRERTREIGTLRSLGYRRWQMLLMFALEAAVLALLAGGIGAVLAWAVRWAISAARIRYSAGLLAEEMILQVGWSPAMYLQGLAFLLAVAVIAAWLAARKVVGLAVAEALNGPAV